MCIYMVVWLLFGWLLSFWFNCLMKRCSVFLLNVFLDSRVVVCFLKWVQLSSLLLLVGVLGSLFEMISSWFFGVSFKCLVLQVIVGCRFRGRCGFVNCSECSLCVLKCSMFGVFVEQVFIVCWLRLILSRDRVMKLWLCVCFLILMLRLVMMCLGLVCLVFMCKVVCIEVMIKLVVRFLLEMLFIVMFQCCLLVLLNQLQKFFEILCSGLLQVMIESFVESSVLGSKCCCVLCVLVICELRDL